MNAYNAAAATDGPPAIADVAKHLHNSKTGEEGVADRNARKRREDAGFKIKNGLVFPPETELEVPDDL